MDALLFCGDGGASRPVRGENKAFLDIEGSPVFIHVLRALEKVSRIRRIFIIGDKDRLDNFLSEKERERVKPVITLRQWGGLASNAWNGFLATLDDYSPGDEKKRPELNDRTVFAVAGDAPLVSPEEIDEFLDSADMEKFDYVVGLTPEETMRRYYPTVGKPGIKMAYFHLREGLFRVNNMHMARPFAFANREAIQKMYDTRYQKKIMNVLRLSRDLWRFKPVRSRIWIYFLMQASMTLSRLGFKGFSEMTRRRVGIEDVMEAIGQILGLRAGYAVTRRGGAALDIDNETDYSTMKRMFAEWKAAQA